MDIFGRKRIAELEKANANLNRRLQGWEDSTINNMKKHTNQLSITNRAIGRIIAKFDPAYNQDHLDPETKAASDKIGDDVISRLLSEHKLSNPLG